MEKGKLKIYLPLIIFIFTIANGCGDGGGGSSAVETMSSEMAKNMLKLKGYDFNEANFFRAVRVDDTGAVRAFFDAGIDPNAKNQKGETALTFAVENSKLKTVKVLAEKADINLQDALGRSPLHLAFFLNKVEVFQFLLDQNADVNVAGATYKLKNQSALYLAVTRGRADLVQNLLERGADPNITDNESGFALAEACIGASVNPQIVKVLLDKGANVNQQEKNGATALIYIAANPDADAEKRQQIVKLLLDKGADKKIKDVEKKTALDWAKKSGNKDILETLK